jgi:hypothetical protein
MNCRGDMGSPENSARFDGAELRRALNRLETEVRAGLLHGFFELEVAGEVIKDHKRRLIIRAESAGPTEWSKFLGSEALPKGVSKVRQW